MSKHDAGPMAPNPTLAERINIGEFNAPPRPTKMSNGSKATIDWQAECRSVKDRFKAALFAEYDVTANPLADHAYDLAAGSANGAGDLEILNHFEDLVPFLRAIRTDNNNAFVQTLNVWELSYETERCLRSLLFLKESDVDKAQAHGEKGGSIERNAYLTVEYEGRLYLLGPEIRTSYDTPAEIRDRALAKLKNAGLTPEEMTAIGVLP